MVMRPGKHETSKQRYEDCRKVHEDYKDVGRSTTVHNLLFYAHTLCMNYVTKPLLLASFTVRSKQMLCFVHG